MKPRCGDASAACRGSCLAGGDGGGVVSGVCADTNGTAQSHTSKAHATRFTMAVVSSIAVLWSAPSPCERHAKSIVACEVPDDTVGYFPRLLKKAAAPR